MEDGRWTLSAEWRAGDAAQTLWYRTSAGPLAEASEPFLVAALLPCARLGVPLRSMGPISRRLDENLTTIQEIFHVWDRRYHTVPVTAPLRGPGPSTTSARPTACFFTGGVDSFYTLLKHRQEIDLLVFVHGFDIPLGQGALRERVSAKLREVAAVLGKELLEVETNIRPCTGRYVSWEDFHGAALAAVALALAPHVRRIFVAASRCFADLSPWGSHPLVDPLWSTEDVAIVHDGCEATRLEKTRRIVECEAVRRTLRVCWENPRGMYNCGRCTKCLFAKARLRALGALARVETFDDDLDLGALERLPLDRPPVESTDLYEYVVRCGRDRALERALWRYLHEWHYRGLRGQLARAARLLGRWVRS
jgi:hypothetical protein